MNFETYVETVQEEHAEIRILLRLSSALGTISSALLADDDVFMADALGEAFHALALLYRCYYLPGRTPNSNIQIAKSPARMAMWQVMHETYPRLLGHGERDVMQRTIRDFTAFLFAFTAKSGLDVQAVLDDVAQQRGVER